MHQPCFIEILVTLLLLRWSEVSCKSFMNEEKGFKFLSTYIREREISSVNFLQTKRPSSLPSRPGLTELTPQLLKAAGGVAVGATVGVHMVQAGFDPRRIIPSEPGGGVLNIAFLEQQGDVELLVEFAQHASLFRDYNWLIIGSIEFLEGSLLKPYLPVDNKVLFAQPVMHSQDVLLVDVYQVVPKADYKVRVVGRWSESSAMELKFPKDEIMLTRTNLTGLHLRCVTLEQSPYTYLEDGPADGEVRIVKGHMADVWGILQAMFGFTYSCRRPTDGRWGGKRDGVWTGLIKELVDGQADVVVAPLDTTPERALAVDLTVGLRNTGSRLVMKRRALMDSTWTSFTQEFTKEAWGATFLFLLLAPPLLTFITYKSPSEEERVPLKDSYVIAFGAFAYQGSAIEMTSTAGRIMFLVIFVATLLTYSHYTSALVASFTVASTIHPFGSLQDLVKAGNYELGYMADVSLEDEFKNSQNSPFKEAWENLIKPNLDTLPKTNLEGIDRVVAGGYVHVVDQSVFTYEFYNRCAVFALTPQYFSKPTGLAFTKDSPYVKLFNQQLLKMRNGGILDRSWEQLQPPKSLCKTTGIVSLSLKTVFTAFVILIVGGSMSVILLPLEKLHWYTFRKSKEAQMVAMIN